MAQFISNSSINENSSNGTIIGNLSTLDPDVGDTDSYTLINNADGRFTLDRNKLLVAASNRLDFETNKNSAPEEFFRKLHLEINLYIICM
jgi:hypothetical protein